MNNAIAIPFEAANLFIVIKGDTVTVTPKAGFRVKTTTNTPDMVCVEARPALPEPKILDPRCLISEPGQNFVINSPFGWYKQGYLCLRNLGQYSVSYVARSNHEERINIAHGSGILLPNASATILLNYLGFHEEPTRHTDYLSISYQSYPYDGGVVMYKLLPIRYNH